MITVNDDIELDKAKETAGKILEKLSDEEKKFYDVQIFVSKDTDDAKYSNYNEPACVCAFVIISFAGGFRSRSPGAA